LLSWRAACLARHGELSAKRILAAQRIGELVARVQQPVLRHWNHQAMKISASAAVTTMKATAVDRSALQSLFSNREASNTE